MRRQPSNDETLTLPLLPDLTTEREVDSGAPLAARMRPRSIDEFVGQEHLLGQGRPLRTQIDHDRVSSAVLHGPAGTGKTTLALIIAKSTRSHFEMFSAVGSGVADVRRVVREARQRSKLLGRKTILFVDEIHRFNRAQQDAFLPHVEDGTIILIGATTENPFFSINTPLLSRARLYRFDPLSDTQIHDLIQRALKEDDRGLGGLQVEVDPAGIKHLVTTCNGDARAALNVLEVAVLATPEDEDGVRHVSLSTLVDALQRPALNYDREGDQHYDVVSAFIKSMRGGDADAALYWMARMIAAGEDPRFIARRIVVHAAEDVGMADPTALLVATSAAHAVEFVGLPEAQIPLAQAVIHIATAPKSNSVAVAIQRAMSDVRERKPAPVPIHLRDASYPGAARLGHGKGYLYPHDYPGHVVPQEYLPEEAKSGVYYEPAETEPVSSKEAKDRL